MKKFPFTAEQFSAGLMLGQREYLEDAQKIFGIGPTEMAKKLGVNYNTYKAWLYGKNPMPGVARVAIDCLTRHRKK